MEVLKGAEGWLYKVAASWVSFFKGFRGVTVDGSQVYQRRPSGALAGQVGDSRGRGQVVKAPEGGLSAAWLCVSLVLREMTELLN